MLKLDKYIRLNDSIHEAADLTDWFSEVDLRRIGQFVWDGYQTDLKSRRSWELRNAAGMDLALQVVEEKSFPWAGASNVAFPLVTIAAMQFHARAYPGIINGKEIVRVKPGLYGTEEERRACTLAARHMNSQLLDVSSAWEEGSDRLLLHYSIIGCAFKKTYYSSLEGENVSELVFATDLVIDYFAKSVETARRKTHRYQLSRNALLEGMRTDPPKYRRAEKMAWFESGPQPVIEAKEGANRDGTSAPTVVDPSTPFNVLEQHCWMDLDDDGYEEPYVVTIDAGSKEVIRLVTRWERKEDIRRNARGQVLRINAMEYFTKFGFIPSPDGSIYDIGFGVLLGPLNESVSTIINQLIDAGTMASTGGGFLGKGVKVRGGSYSFAPNEWKRVDSTGDDLRKNIVPLDVREPSPTLFQLLGLLIEYTNRISGTMETMVGENPGQNTPKSNMDAMIEQGMKVYAAIFKRTWRCFKEEFRKLYILNAIYSPPNVRQWFLYDPRRCAPVADPNIASDAERRTRALLIAERALTVPGYDPLAVEVNLLRALHVDEPEMFYRGPPQQSAPDPKLLVEQMRQEGKDKDRQMKFQLFIMQVMAEQRETEAQILKLQAEAARAVAQAEGERDNQIIVAMQTTIAAMKERSDDARKRIEQLIKLAELESEPERKPANLDNIRRLALAASNGRPAAPVRQETGVPQGAMGFGENPE